MRKPMMALAAVFVFTACDGNPFVTTTETTDPTTTTTVSATAVPDVLKNNLTSLTYDPVAKTVTVAISGIDSTPDSVTYTRNLAAEASLGAGYEAYSVQEDALDRLFVAVVRESFDESVRAGVVSDGGQFNSFAWGSHYERTGNFDKPEIGTGPGAGQVSYAGNYVGLDNWSGPNPTLPPGTDPSIQPQGPGRVTGQVFINANFSDMQLNGSVFNRAAIDLDPGLYPTGFPLDTIVLRMTDITADGTFLGNVEPDGAPDQVLGQYGGLFGGVDSASLGGTLFIDEYAGAGTHETGVFVLTQCGMAGEDVALCTGTAP